MVSRVFVAKVSPDIGRFVPAPRLIPVLTTQNRYRSVLRYGWISSYARNNQLRTTSPVGR